MTSFQDKERAEEAKFAHDEEIRFLAVARGDKLFARWAAARTDASAEEVEVLTRALLSVPVNERHDAEVVRIADSFLQRYGRPVPAEALGAELRRCLVEAAAGH